MFKKRTELSSCNDLNHKNNLIKYNKNNHLNNCLQFDCLNINDGISPVNNIETFE